MKTITKETCELCGKIFRGSINSIQRQKARHISNGQCEERRNRQIIERVKRK